MRRIKLNTLVGGLCCLVLVWVLFNWLSRPQSQEFRAQQNDPGEDNEEKQGRKAQEVRA